MTAGRILIVRHQAPLRTVGEGEVLTALTDAEHRLPRFEIVVDSRALGEAVEGGHWRSSDEFVRLTADKIRAEVATEPSEVHYFGMPEVPHVLGIGAHFGDEVLVHAHDYDRDRDTWAWRSGVQSLAVKVAGMPSELVTQSGEATLVVEVSYVIDQRDVDAVVGTEILTAIRVSAVPEPAPGIVRSAEHVQAVRGKVRDALAAIARYRPGTSLIHLFVAGPVSACFAIGQELRLRNGRDVMTYRYRAADATERYKPALILTARELPASSRPVSEAERSVAADLRAVFAEALTDVKAHAAHLADSERWYSKLQPQEAPYIIQPFETLAALSSVVFPDDLMSDIPRGADYGFSKERPRTWQISDALILSFFAASNGDRNTLRRMAGLFFYHEYLHDWQDLTKYTAEDVGSFANCLETVDYMADTYAFAHQLDYAMRNEGLEEQRAQEYLAEQIILAIASFWAFEPPPPNYEWQERRLRRYLNWYWRRVQVREAPDLATALRTLFRRPSIEIAGFKYRTAGGRHYVLLNQPRAGDVPELGIVLEDGRFDRRGTTTDLGIVAVMRAFGDADRQAIDRFFNSLMEHLRPTGGVFAN